MKKTILCFAILIAIVSCKPDKGNEPIQINYSIETGTAQHVTNYKAELTGSITGLSNENIAEYGHVWSTQPNPTIDLASKTVFTEQETTSEFTSKLLNLKKGTLYFVRAYTIDENGEHYGPEVSFETGNEFFSFEVGYYLYSNQFYEQSAWIMIYSEAGSLLALEKISDNTTYNFDFPENESSKEFIVQIFVYDDYYSDAYSDDYTLYSFPKSSPSTWLLGYEKPYVNPEQIGEITVELTDASAVSADWLFASNKNNHGGYSLEYPALMPQYYNPDNLFLAFAQDGEASYYKWIEGIGIDNNFTFSKADFNQMTHFTDYNIPENDNGTIKLLSADNLSTEAIEEYLIYYEHFENKRSIRLYYPGDLFNSYYTYTYYHKDNISERNIIFDGNPIKDFFKLDNEVTIIDNDIFNFKASIEGKCDRITHKWDIPIGADYWDNFMYLVIGSESTVMEYTAPELPDELVSLNPDHLNLNNLLTGPCPWSS